ncbi:unnamed protein product [marine sediment metagenome]|uniref:Uncharacterized protein n=1 Tax=marine sediment metagenome TaxID=412755 RepID=X0U9I7_9ZZZZ
MEGMFFLLLALYVLLKVFMHPLTVFNNPKYPGRKALVAAVSRQEDPLPLKSESCSHE